MHPRDLNTCTGQPANVIDLLSNFCDHKITKGNWENLVMLIMLKMLVML